VHVRPETSTAIVKLSVFLTPDPLAVKVTLVVAEARLPDVIEKATELEPEGTLTEVGAVSVDALLVRVKDSGAEATLPSASVQVALEALPMICVPDTVGRAHVKEVSGVAGTTVNKPVLELPPAAITAV
jgi:hypothetical protein